MKPELLKLSGIYSYKNETTIDFSTLCSAELFGIFGNVGSGKSAVIEAITYVLYGRIERLSSRVYYNMMNLASNRMSIDFIFGHRDKRYRFTFEAKRNSRNFDKIGTPERSAYVEEDGRWVPLFDKDREVSVAGIIGLSYDNFRRTVIVPQGRFQEFLHLEKKGRTEMLMELFQLDRFDLHSRTAALGSRNAEKIAELRGEIGPLGDIDQAQLNEAEVSLADGEERVQVLQADLAASAQRLAELRELSKISAKTGELRTSLGKAEQLRPEMEMRREGLLQYRRCRDLFALKLDRRDSLASDLAASETASADARNRQEAAASALNAAETEFAGVRERQSGLDGLRQRAGWFSQLESIRADEAEAARIKGELETAEADAGVLREQGLSLARETEAAEAELEQLGSDELTSGSLGELSALYKSLADAEASVEGGRAAVSRLRDGSAEAEVLAANLPLKELGSAGLISSEPADIAAAEKAAAELEAQEGESAELLRSMIIAAGISAEVAKIASSLEPGAACPVCGSVEHPHPAEPGALGDEELAGEKRRQAEIQELSSEFRRGLSAAKEELAARSAQLAAYEQQLSAAEGLRASITGDWPDGEFGPEDGLRFEAAKAKLIESEQKRRHLVSILTTMRRDADGCRSRLGAVDAAIAELKLSLATASVSAKTKREAVDEDFLAECGSLDSSSASENRRRLLAEIEAVESEFRRAEARLAERRTAAERALASLDMRTAEHGRLAAALAEADSELEDAAAAEGFDGSGEIRRIIGRPVDVEAEQAYIENFTRRADALARELAELEKAAAGRAFDEDELNSEKEREASIRRELSGVTENIGGLREFAARLRLQLERKQELSSRLDELNLRAENIRTLLNLFKGKKFIDWVSTVYLKELCDAANMRFRKLTKEALRLELDENNNFIIRDYLNEGRTRSVKTLSGGQTFQAAFSLSLALADSIGTEKAGFFFLDEGFGSLDRESLSLVFDSLKSLKRENRTVGVISHVEELKQEIDTYITVTKETDDGSLVNNSWN